MINKSMKKYQDILNMASQHALTENEKRSEVNKIVDILELAEKYLGRPLVESEVGMFTELLIEEEKKEEKTEPTFKKGNYKIEIMTPQGKVIRTASSQKGILDVIHSAKTYRILDQNNRDITSKVKAFVKEREKQAMLRMRLKKKSRLRESVLNENKGKLFLDMVKNFWKKATAETAEKAGKEAAQETAEKAGKQAGKKAGKEAAKKTAQETAEKAGKEAAQETAEKAGKGSSVAKWAKRAGVAGLGYFFGTSGTGVDYSAFNDSALDDVKKSGNQGDAATQLGYSRGGQGSGDGLETDLTVGKAGQKFYI